MKLLPIFPWARVYQNETHVEAIQRILSERSELNRGFIAIEIGTGVSTMAFARSLRGVDSAKLYSIDISQEVVDRTEAETKPIFSNIEFRVGDSLESLDHLYSELTHVDFVLLDSAPSAMRTFEEFKILESKFRVGSCILIDNASSPECLAQLSECRKGKILVPYLLASPVWEVFFYPRSGDSMVFAQMSDHMNHADKNYEYEVDAQTWSDSLRRRFSSFSNK